MADKSHCVNLEGFDPPWRVDSPGEWWHALTMVCDCGVTSTVYLGESVHPERFVAELEPSLLVMVCLQCNLAGVLRYVRSWDHEPSGAERVAAGLEDDDWLEGDGEELEDHPYRGEEGEE